MRSKRVVSLVVMLMLVLVAATPVSADLPPGGWWGGIQVANLGTKATDISLEIYAEGGPYSASEENVAPGAAANFVTPLLDTSSGQDTWRGAGIASAGEPIAAVATVTNLKITWGSGGGVDGGTGRAMYPGVNAPDTTVFFPLVKNGFPASNPKSTSFFVQNAGDATATFYATFTDIDGNTYTNPYANIAKGEMTLIDPADASFPAGSYGSLVVTSTVPLAGVVNEYKVPASGQPATDLMATRGFAPSDADTTLLFPIFKNTYINKHVGIQIQNTGSTTATVDLTAKETVCGAGTTPGTQTAQLKIPAGGSGTFLGTSILQQGCLAAATITSDQPIVGTGSESQLFTSQFTVYFGFKQSAATQKVVAPLYKEVFGDGNTSGLQIQNISNTAANCTLIWSTVGTTNAYTATDVIPADSAATYYRVNMDPLNMFEDTDWTNSTRVPEGTNNGVTVMCDQNIVGVVQEARPGAAAAQQDAGNYEAFNQ